MAELGPVQFPAQMVHELSGKPCPACGVPVASALVDTVVNTKPSEKPSPFGVVMVDVSAQAMMFTLKPCGCRFDMDGEPVPHEVPC